ncbi:hypothetical protein [Streptomyces sp. NPDC088847]|uniref:hypothetical protein n=1 Tax=Streptomyces sp. NPDC088847 TaxID=3365909 RepID=UPI0038213EF1
MSAYLAAALALGALAGYLAGRGRPCVRLIDWAADQLTERPAWSPRFCAAAPIALVATALVWLVHPRRSRANCQAHQAAKRRYREPVPQYDPGWAARRNGPET